MKTVRFGIVGLGNMGSGHAGSFLSGKITDGVLTAVCDNNKEKLARFAEKHPEITAFDDYNTMLKQAEIDAVIIAVPHYEHPPMSIEAFKHGKHVMCEKPAGVYTKQVAEMNAEAGKHNVVFGMMFNQRTDPVYRKMREIIQNGELGNIRRVNWIITSWYRSQCYYDSGDWRATWSGEGGGVLLNQCPHNLDLWQWICGMPSKITAFCHEGKWHEIEVEDDVTVYAEYPNGATGVLVTSTGDAPGTNRFEITGDMGKLVCEGGKLTFFKNEISEQEFSRVNRESFGAPKCERITIETPGENLQHVGVLRAFVDKILGRGELIARGEEGINGLTLSNAMHLSSWTGKTIELPIDEELFYAELMKRAVSGRS